MSSGNAASPLRKAANQRPGGRTSQVTKRVFAATMGLLEEGGFAAVTFQQVAERAEIGRATLYRRWPEPAFLVGDALAATAADRIKITDTGTLRGDLSAMLAQIGSFIDSSTGRAAIIATLSGRQQPEITSFAQQLWERRRGDVTPIFERARARGEIVEDTDPDVIFALAAGSLYARLIVMAMPNDQDWLDSILNQLLRAVKVM